MSLMEKLTKLYGVDQQLRGLRSRLESAQAHLTGQTRQFDDIANRLNELETRKLQLKAQIGNLETEAAAHDEHLEKYRDDLNSAATNKQYTAVLTELNTFKELRSKLDDSILAEMDTLEAIDGETEEVRAQRNERQKVVDLAAAKLKEREKEIGSRLRELESERENAAADIPANELSIFDEMADAYKGEAMAAVEEIDRRRREYSCGECNMLMPFEQVAQLMTTDSGVMRCTACHRILFLQEEMRGSLVPK